MSTTLSTLARRLSEGIGDWLQANTTTNISAGVNVASTTLNERDDATDDVFNNHWLYFSAATNNSGIERRVKDYFTSGGICTVYGANLIGEAGAVTFDLGRYEHSQKVKAINRAREEVFPALHKRVDDLSLVSGNSLPDGSFDWWTSTSAHKFLVGSSATLAQTKWSATNDEFIRGQRGSTSMKVTDSGSGAGYAVLSSDVYPRLLDLMGRTVDFYAWAYPVDTADDGVITIYTKQADGTAQTLSSTTANPKGEYTLLLLESQDLNDDLVEVQIRFSVTTASKNVYFDDAIVCGKHLFEYLLPEKLQNGYVDQVDIQVAGYSDVIAYDLHPRDWEPFGFSIVDDGTYKYLKLPYLYGGNRQIRILGDKPLETLSVYTDTISLDGQKLNLLIEYAAHKLYEIEKAGVSSKDKSRYEEESLRHLANYYRMINQHSMTRTSQTLKIPAIG